MTNQVNDFLFTIECESREMLHNLIVEYKELRGEKEEETFVPMGLKLDNTTLLSINIDWDDFDEDGNFSFKYKRSGTEKIKFSIQNMLKMIENLNERNKPYRVLKKYREKFEEKKHFTIVEYINYNPTEKEYPIDGLTFEEIFLKFYKMNRTYRYCNGHYYKFKLKEIDDMFCQWEQDLPHDMSMSLYYGNGIVD